MKNDPKIMWIIVLLGATVLLAIILMTQSRSDTTAVTQNIAALTQCKADAYSQGQVLDKTQTNLNEAQIQLTASTNSVSYIMNVYEMDKVARARIVDALNAKNTRDCEAAVSAGESALSEMNTRIELYSQFVNSSARTLDAAGINYVKIQPALSDSANEIQMQLAAISCP